jgi:hypothetical protein
MDVFFLRVYIKNQSTFTIFTGRQKQKGMENVVIGFGMSICAVTAAAVIALVVMVCTGKIDPGNGPG